MMNHEPNPCIHPRTKQFMAGLKITLGFEEHRTDYWYSLPEINKKYLAKKFKISTKEDNDELSMPMENPWELLHALTGKPEGYCVVEIAHQLKLIDSHKKSDLLNEIFGSDQESKISKKVTSPRTEKPVWNRSEGVLYFRGKIVLKTQVRKKLTISQEILEAFQNQKWPEKIIDPFSKTIKTDRRFSVNYLNKLLKTSGLSFSRSPDRKYIHCHF